MNPPFRLWSLVLTVFCFLINDIDSASKELANEVAVLDIKQALNTTDPLWVYWQTDSNYITIELEMNGNEWRDYDKETCIRIRMDGISDTDYNFTETILLGEEEDVTQYYGRFVNDTTPPKSVKYADGAGAPSEMMTLQYSDPHPRKCYVMFIYSLDGTYPSETYRCRMYLPDGDVDKGPSSSCETFFRYRCNSTVIYSPYKPNCKTTSSGGNEKAQSKLST